MLGPWLNVANSVFTNSVIVKKSLYFDGLHGCRQILETRNVSVSVEGF